MTKLTNLRQRINAATEGDAWLNGDLALFFNQVPEGLRRSHAPDRWYNPATGSSGDDYQAPAYSTSVDAALALVNKVLPGWSIEQACWPTPKSKGYSCSLGNFGSGEEYVGVISDLRPTLPLAILSGMLEVLVGGEE